MHQTTIYAFDFDGVICDSAIETSITGWKAAQTIWQDMSSTPPLPALISAFRDIRPSLETGYEAILVMRLLFLGRNTQDIAQHYHESLASLIEQQALETHTLKKRFGETRDAWIQTRQEEWLEMNPLYPGFRNLLQNIKNDSWYIITTKQERFVKRILEANGVLVNDNQLFGMDRKINKQEALLHLGNKHPEQSILFIEDRLQTLLDITKNPALQEVSLKLVAWGYNTAEQREIARQAGIPVISQFGH